MKELCRTLLSDADKAQIDQDFTNVSALDKALNYYSPASAEDLFANAYQGWIENSAGIWQQSVLSAVTGPYSFVNGSAQSIPGIDNSYQINLPLMVASLLAKKGSIPFTTVDTDTGKMTSTSVPLSVRVDNFESPQDLYIGSQVLEFGLNGDGKIVAITGVPYGTPDYNYPIYSESSVPPELLTAASPHN